MNKIIDCIVDIKHPMNKRNATRRSIMIVGFVVKPRIAYFAKHKYPKEESMPNIEIFEKQLDIFLHNL